MWTVSRARGKRKKADFRKVPTQVEANLWLCSIALDSPFIWSLCYSHLCTKSLYFNLLRKENLTCYLRSWSCLNLCRPRTNNPQRCFSPSLIMWSGTHKGELCHPRLHSNSVSEVKLRLLFFLDFTAWLSCEQDLHHHKSINIKCWLGPKLWSHYWEDRRGCFYVVVVGAGTSKGM